MSPIEFPDAPMLTGHHGDLGLMIWSTRSLDEPAAEPELLVKNSDMFKPDSFWLESEMAAPSLSSRRFMLAWSREGQLLGQTQWDGAMAKGHGGGCAIAGSAFETRGVLPTLSHSDLMERVARSFEFARALSAGMPCALSLDRVSLHETHSMASKESPAMEQILQIARWQNALGLSACALSDHERACRGAKAVWAASDPQGLVVGQQTGFLQRLIARVTR